MQSSSEGAGSGGVVGGGRMYPWYREASQLGQLCAPMATTIKTETGYNDCMLALDYAAQSKVIHLLYLFSIHSQIFLIIHHPVFCIK